MKNKEIVRLAGEARRRGYEVHEDGTVVVVDYEVSANLNGDRREVKRFRNELRRIGVFDR